ncbi:type II and III secretion system protein family protein [Kordiimonas sp. SCSIO 12610]|uniref:type II and III secretion system protein family protein n=1 Tax=Kordiimonas sp. SCSIO 12610 TaxID=2829597 RepID=UPI00210C1FF9|nr:type II and III secretion system protein family protein [Kordiimonas sp. SCSIO 12610]UTW56007.1 type II and III secretion system protein family protein [Kordiimonas sp. SCSIO 12610]
MPNTDKNTFMMSVEHSTRASIIFSALALFLVLIISSQALHAQLSTDSNANVVHTTNERLNIEVNKGTLIRLKRPAQQVFVANPGIADISVKSEKVIYVFGVQSGDTTIYALDKDDNTIFSSDIVVTRSLDNVKETLQRVLPNTEIGVSLVGNMVVLEGRVSSPDEAATAERIARSQVGADDVLNRLEITQPTQVNLRVRIAEVSRSVLKQIGFNWEVTGNTGDFSFGFAQGRNVFDIVENPAAPGEFIRNFVPGEAPSVAGSLVTGGLDLNYLIDALENEGFVSVLAEPNLTALTGQTANFLAGGEFPIPVPQGFGGALGIQFREFGVRLEFAPTVLDSGRISMRVQPEVSDISTAGAITLNSIQVPAITTRRAETTVELGSGQSFAIAGLIQNDITQTANKVPGLGDIPILGALFRSDEFRRDETELLIVVTPYIVRPVSDRQLALPTDGYVAPDDMARFLKGDRWKANTKNNAANLDQHKGPSLKSRAGFQLD